LTVGLLDIDVDCILPVLIDDDTGFLGVGEPPLYLFRDDACTFPVEVDCDMDFDLEGGRSGSGDSLVCSVVVSDDFVSTIVLAAEFVGGESSISIINGSILLRASPFRRK
jgi:hypothetical protein